MQQRAAQRRHAKERVERIRQALASAGICGVSGAEIDHIELFGPPSVPGADSKNFVLCPGRAYDRSPCGTGTSARMAQWAAKGKLKAGDKFIHESIIGSEFVGRIEGRLFVFANIIFEDPRARSGFKVDIKD